VGRRRRSRKAIDTSEYYVICVNAPGSCYGTTGPASENPETGEPYGTDFPPVTVGDWTRAQRELLDTPASAGSTPSSAAASAG